MKKMIAFAIWPAVCGLLAALLMLQLWQSQPSENIAEKPGSEHIKPELIKSESELKEQQPVNRLNNDSTGELASDNRAAAQSIETATEEATKPTAISDPLMQRRHSYAAAVQRAAPAVVNIYTSKTVASKISPSLNDPIFRDFFYRRQVIQPKRVQRNLGSGVIMSGRGFILTNYHVIKDADQIVVLLYDGREAIPKLVGADPESDLAVLKIDLPNLSAIQLGDPSDAMVGDIVLAIGNPYGFGQSVSQGIISATGRYGLQLHTYENFIQTDAAINPGNSGGALVDVAGKLLGINSAIFSQTGGYQGIGLAIPADSAIHIMSDLIEYGQVIRGWLGIQGNTVPEAVAEANGLVPNNGIMVKSIATPGPAADAGIRNGDIIVSINGEGVGDGHAGMNFIAATRPGEVVNVEIVRQGERINVNVKLGTRPS